MAMLGLLRSVPGMSSKQRQHRVEVTFVGAPPVRRIERASGVSDVATEGAIMSCLVVGSFQPFLEALCGYEVLTLTSTPAPSEQMMGDME
jgi:hypothetical protein